MMSASETISFRCKPRLRSVLKEEERRTGVKISDQIRITLERAFDVKDDDEWLPPALRKQDTPPTSGNPVKGKKS